MAADPAVASIERWYARLVSTMQEASSLSVQARYQRLAPVLAEAFDFADMTRLSVGPAFNQASGAQQAAIRQAFQKFIGAFYANRIDGYSSEKFQVDPVVENRGGQRVVKTTLVRPGRRLDPDRLSDERQPGDRYLSRRFDQRSGLASRRILLDHRVRRTRRTRQGASRQIRPAYGGVIASPAAQRPEHDECLDPRCSAGVKCPATASEARAVGSRLRCASPQSRWAGQCCRGRLVPVSVCGLMVTPIASPSSDARFCK